MGTGDTRTRPHEHPLVSPLLRCRPCCTLLSAPARLLLDLLTPSCLPPATLQSALFALAVADIVLVNMWAKDIGRETGAGKPLLKTIFQVNLKLFQVHPDCCTSCERSRAPVHNQSCQVSGKLRRPAARVPRTANS